MAPTEEEEIGLRAPFLHRIRPSQLQRIDFALAALFLVATLPHLAYAGNRPGGSTGTLFGLALGAALPVAVRRRAPLAALLIATVALSVATALGASFAPDPLIALPMYQFAAVRERRESIPGLVLSALALLITAAIGAASHPAEGDASFSVLVSIAAWFVGDSVRVRRAYTAGLAEQASQRASEALERAQRGVAEERLRIARDLHDVVAHSLSVIAVQSGVGRHVIDTQPEQAKAALAAVETTSRAALGELRRMLGVLRNDGAGGPELLPAPGVGDLEALVVQVRSAGVPVEVVVDPGVTGGILSAALELSVYRVVQEALTNVVKHAGQASARVELRREGEDLVVEVLDDGVGKSLNWPTPLGAEHHGIVGMRERVAAFGGAIETGPRAEGGFRVLARLPVGGEPVR
jgi:signal transduction histidine kinase